MSSVPPTRPVGAQLVIDDEKAHALAKAAAAAKTMADVLEVTIASLDALRCADAQIIVSPRRKRVRLAPRVARAARSRHAARTG